MEGWEAKTAPLLPAPDDEDDEGWREFEPLEEHAGLTEEQAAGLLDTSEEERPTLGKRELVCFGFGFGFGFFFCFFFWFRFRILLFRFFRGLASCLGRRQESGLW